MEVMLQTVIIVFMLFLCSLCLFAVLVIARDMVAESMGKRKRAFSSDATEPKEQVVKEVTIIKEVPAVAPQAITTVQAPPPAPQPAPEAPAVTEEPPKAEETAPVDEEIVPTVTPASVSEIVDDNAVRFSATQHDMETKYAMLSKDAKAYFDAIAKHALSKEGVKANLTKSYHDYKIGASRLIRMSIKRGEIVCEFVFIDRNFKNYASQADLKFKSSGTVIKVTEPSAVGVAKDGIDLVFNQILEEREYKKQLARERRKAKRQAQAADTTEVTANG